MSKEEKSAPASAAPIEVSSSEFKNGWHNYLERVERVRETVVVTRYGKPVAKLVPYDEDGQEENSLFGHLANTVTVLGDIVAPTGEVWEADA